PSMSIDPADASAPAAIEAATAGDAAPRHDHEPAAEPGAAPPAIARLAWRVFAPIDLVINVAINGTIAWWLFGSRPTVPLTGPAGLTSMVLPMSLILATLTTFSGFCNAVRERRAGRATPPLPPATRWAARACVEAITTGVCSWFVAFVVARGLAAAPSATVDPIGAVLAITAIAGLLAFLLHGRAVTRGGRI
ncbi:MAG: hypothetical protein ACKOTB_07500, partial [Planctomycetia bacterium]